MSDVRAKRARLILLAAASLYFELAIIRFTSAEVLYLGYFSNFILISAFLGLGLGFLSVRRGIDLAPLLPFLLLFLFALVLVSKVDAGLLANHFGDFFFGNISHRAGLPGILLLTALFVVTALLFVSLGQQVGIAFSAFEPLVAYTLDIGGSLLGITVFFAQSAMWSGPETWIITGSLLLALGFFFGGARSRAAQICGAGVCVLLLLASASPQHEVIWSMYQKLEVIRPQSGPARVLANGVAHQFLHDAHRANRVYYGYPYQVHTEHGGSLDDVLIIGAGSGTDVAVALLRGAKRVDAVEIDPGIVFIGERYHPDAPYQDPRVHIHVTDGRQFLRNTGRTYDLIIFALPDSLMRISSMSNVRLESYLFTMEAFADVRAHLAKGGTFALYNQYRWKWLRNKIATMLARSFGRAPNRLEYKDTTVFAVGANIPESSYSDQGFSGVATDDWPFVYMRSPQVHWLYLGMIGMFIVVALVGVKFLAPAGTLRRPDWPFFFMGTAFLLLETKSISLFSLLFGTTWMVNCLAFAGVLLSVLVANLCVQYLGVRRRPLLFTLLFAGLGVAYFCSPSIFLDIESQVLRYLVATALIFLPIFLANLVFSREFKDAEASTRSFGWNLLGAVLGGGLEYVSLATGHRSLIFIVAACYGLATIFFVREARRSAAAG